MIHSILGIASGVLPPATLYVGSFLAALAILILVHEAGHFLAARSLGVGVTRFSLGFGPRLFGFRRGETEYVVCAIPFGGYVKLVGESEEEEDGAADPSLAERSFSRKPVRVRMAVVAAGPAGNLLFSVLAFWLFFLGGVPALSPRIDPAPGSPASSAGFRTGDTVLSVGGEAVRSYEEAASLLVKAPGGSPVAVRVLRDGEELSLSLPLPGGAPEEARDGGGAVPAAGPKETGLLPWLPARVGEVVKGTPADRAGLKGGDEILAVDDGAVSAWAEVSRKIRATPEGKEVRLRVRRGGEEISFAVVPEFLPAGEGKEATKAKREPRIGVVGKQETVRLPLGPAEALGRGVSETWRLVAMTGDVVAKLVRRVLPASTLGGPILIAQMAGEQAREGILPFAYFLGLLSVNLGVLNLLPVPVLDGGHLVLFALEALLGRPLSVAARMRAQQVGLAFILGLTLLVFYNDIARLLHGR